MSRPSRRPLSGARRAIGFTGLGSNVSATEILVFLAIAAVFYLLPSLIAVGKRNPDRGSVFMINLWLGWTIVGWITAMGWALDAKRE